MLRKGLSNCRLLTASASKCYEALIPNRVFPFLGEGGTTAATKKEDSGHSEIEKALLVWIIANIIWRREPSYKAT